MGKNSVCGLVLAFCALTTFGGPVVSILEKDGRSLISPGAPPPRYDELAKYGLIVDIAEAKQPLTWKRLKKYPMLIMTNFATNHYGKLHDPQELGDLLNRYLEEGGGILYIGQEQMGSHHWQDEMNAWLKPYGAQILWKSLDDPEHTYKNPPVMPFQRPQIFWTKNVAEHTITRDVKTLFFRNSLFYSPYIRPLQVDKDWTVLVSSMPTSVSFDVVRPLGAGIAKKIEGTEKIGAFPVLAVRQVGKGRLALLAHNPGPLYYDLGKPAMGQVCAKNGDGKTPSDWMTLFRNLCLWLSEPARKKGYPGGVTKKAEFEIRPDWGHRQAIDWERPDISWPDDEIKRLYGVHYNRNLSEWREMAAGNFKSFKFLVAAKTELGGGKGTIADWKKAAKAAGYSGVVFRENILDLTKEQWETFQEECRKASDDTFLAVPGQEFVEWEGNRFIRFGREIPYHSQERLTKDGKAVREQLHFFFDCNKHGHEKTIDVPGLPANMPLKIKGNTTPWWSYRVYSAVPVYVYKNGKLIENNLKEWKELVNRIEFPTPVAMHLIDDPSKVETASREYNLHLIAPSLKDLRENPSWQKYYFGTGSPNAGHAYLSNGPEIDAFLGLGNYRTTLGSRGIDGSYRYRIIVRAHGEVPIKTVELWGGGDCLRRYSLDKKNVYLQIEGPHDRQRGLWLKVVDADGKTAIATGVNVHDKMLYLQWCGDHCNMLPGGCGVDVDGNPSSFGVPTHVRMKYFSPTGPGASFGDAMGFIPYGTDTSIPSLGLDGKVMLHGEDGGVPAQNNVLIPETSLWFCCRDVMITRQDVKHVVDRNRYMGKDAVKPYDSSYFSGWGAYFKLEPTKDFDIVQDDIDFQRDAGQPAFQLCRGLITFKRDVRLNGKKKLNLEFGRIGWKRAMDGLYLNGEKLAAGSFEKILSKGDFFTFPEIMGHGTIFALDDGVAIRGSVNKDGESVFWYGYSLGDKTFSKGDELAFHLVIMRWPIGVPVNDHLDAKVAKTLNWRPRNEGVRLKALKGKSELADFGFFVETKDHAFVGELSYSTLSVNIPIRVSGINGNWSASLWRKGQSLIQPLAPDPDGICWLQVDPSRLSGELFIGNVVVCDDPNVVLNLFKRSDGKWELLAHNPSDESKKMTVQGVEKGPVPTLRKSLSLNPGEEVRFCLE